MTPPSPVDIQKTPDFARSVTGHLLLAACSGALIGLSFPQPGWWWCAHIGLVPVTWLAIRTDSAWRLMWTCYLMGWVWWLVRMNWLAQVTVGGYIGLAGVMGVYLPLGMGMVRWIHRRYPIPMALTLPLVWTSLEFIRGNFLAGGLTWFSLGHSQAPYLDDQSPARLIQIADLFGEYGVSFLVAMTNGWIVDLLTPPGNFAPGGFAPATPTPGSSDPGSITKKSIGDHPVKTGKTIYGLPKPIVTSTLIWVTAIVGSWGYGQYRISQPSVTPTRTITLAVVQTNVPQDNKNRPTPDKQASDWDRMLNLTREAAQHPDAPNLIVWPETMVPARLNPEARQRLQSLAQQWALEDPLYAQQMLNEIDYHNQITGLTKQLGVDLIVGAPGLEDEPHPARYNSAYLYRRDGKQAIERYDKIHRVPFGEYIPWVDDWPWLKKLFIEYLSPYSSDYTLHPGKRLTLFKVSNPPAPDEEQNPATERTNRDETVRIATPICFEDTVARICRRMVYRDDGIKRADLLVNLTNDGWYAGTQQGPQHFQIAVLRCVENRVPMVRGVNTGVSGFIDSVGRVGPTVTVNGRRQEVEGFAVHTVETDPRVTLYGRVGDIPMIILVIITAGVVVGGRFRRAQ